MALLTKEQQQRVAEAIATVERDTDAELVTVLAYRSDDYTHIPTLWAAALALLTPGVLAITPLWLHPWDLLLAQWGVFLLLAVLLRWQPLHSRLVPKKLKRWRASHLAHRQFLAQNLHHTNGETGLLIFVSEAEHYVQILADRGIDQHVAPEQWQAIVDAFIAKVRRGETLQGFLDCIHQCGELLKTHVPATHTKNELPNRMIVLEHPY